ncbi:MAG: hypothetical protein O7C75_09875 [Verrucomicrobia bacterium]|nr:hypothetical protein [Verrucomicrobiota bacterium]
MTIKQKINLWIGKLIKVFNPRLLERIQDKQALKRYVAGSGDMDWKLLGYGPRTLYSSSGLRAGDLVIMSGGFCDYDTLSTSREVSIYDLISDEWWDDISIPDDAAETHQAVACEANRFLYWLGGQLGPGVHPCTATCYCLDLQTKEWHRLPDFPKPMYGPTAQYFEGRIHVLGGCYSDRKTSATIHWSLSVKEGKSLEDSWVNEPEVPQHATHRGSAIIGDYLYLPGGQLEETPPVEGDSTFTYTPTTGNEEVIADSFRYHFRERTWQRIAPMSVGVSHHDCTTLGYDGNLLVVGGMKYQDPKTHAIFLTDLIQEYDPEQDCWREYGHLVYRIKSMVCAIHSGRLYVFGGQRDTSRQDGRPGCFLSTIWVAPLK